MEFFREQLTRRAVGETLEPGHLLEILWNGLEEGPRHISSVDELVPRRAIELAGVYVQDIARIGKQTLGRPAEGIPALATSGAGAVLIAAFLLASLLTMSAVSRRIREFGTLKALGWKSGRIVGQVMGESLAIGIIGGAVGVALGFAGAVLVGKFAPPLVSSTPTQIYEAMLTGPEAMPVFNDLTITPQEKRDIIAYVTQVRALPNPGGFSLGRVGPVTEGLVAFLGLLLFMVLAALWITAKHGKAHE